MNLKSVVESTTTRLMSYLIYKAERISRPYLFLYRMQHFLSEYISFKQREFWMSEGSTAQATVLK